MKYAIAADIGGSGIKYAVIDSRGNILFESLKPILPGRVLLTLKGIIGELMDFSHMHAKGICGIGIGVPSVVDNGKVLFANNLPEIDNLQLDEVLEEFQLPVFVDNDANLMGLGEVRYGTADDISDAVFITVGTGIGGALILNGQLYGGYKNRGTELGFIILDAHADDCGMKGSFEAKASITALINDYRSLNPAALPGDVDGKYIVAKYLEKEAHATTAMNRHFHYMAAGIASLVNIFAPQKVIIGGGISEAGSFYCDSIKKLVPHMAMKETCEYTSIEPASLGNKAGCLGAAAMVFSRC